MKSLIHYKPNNEYVGDVIPFFYNGSFYLYYLSDKRNGKTVDEYGYRTPWALVITKDGINYESKGVVLPTGTYEDPDFACYTGSIIKGKDDLFHLFYTAQNNYNSRYFRDGKPLQFVMQASSEDLIHWKKDYSSLMGADESIYEPYDWRDPFIFYNAEKGCYYMLTAARKKGSSEKTGGCVGLSVSDDLVHWTAKEPFYEPHAYLTHECPDLFKMGDWWYLVYSTFSERFATHYRMSKSLQGPWVAPIEDTFDGRAFYAAKTASNGSERWVFGWVPTKRENSDFGQYEWGGSLSLHRLDQEPDGRLTVSSVAGINNYFDKKITNKDAIDIVSEDGLKAVAFGTMPYSCMIEADISYSEGIRNFGISLRQNKTQSNGYYFRWEPYYNRLVFDMWPRKVPGVNQWYIDGDKPFLIELERPCRIREKDHIHIKVIADGDILCCYVNDRVALTTRAYRSENDGWGFFAFDGRIHVENITLSISKEDGYEA